MSCWNFLGDSESLIEFLWSYFTHLGAMVVIRSLFINFETALESIMTAL